jgi:spermidine/putrescine transport system ATP-binding protein
MNTSPVSSIQKPDVPTGSSSRSTTPIITLKNVSKHFQEHEALRNVDLSVYNGEFFTLLGPSGCGKTTLLKMLSGFETPDNGSVLINNRDVTHEPPENRHINMVFQSYALFPHMTIFENVAFGLRCQKYPKDQIKEKVMEALRRVKLTGFEERKPKKLSGGQQQRVAVARAIVNEPLVLLLDEPLSALDYTLRKEMRIQLKALQRRLHLTFILVTHDQEEALSLSDRIAVMNHGQIEQVGTPRDLYEKPTNLFVTNFIGQANIFDTIVIAESNNMITVDILGEHLTLRNAHRFKTGDRIHVVVRPEDMDAWGSNEIPVSERDGLIPGTVEEVIYKGSTVDLVIKLSNKQLISVTEFFDGDDDLIYNIGESVYVNWTIGWEVILPHESHSIDL